MAELNVSRAAGSKRTALRVDLTAMVDLAFLLVTFFMLTTTLSKPRAMDLGMPVDSDAGAVAASRSVTLCLGSHNRVFLYRGQLTQPIEAPQVINIDSKRLRNILLTIKQQVQQSSGKSLVVMVKPAAHSNYGNLVNTLDELNITQNFTYAIEPISSQEMDALKARQMD